MNILAKYLDKIKDTIYLIYLRYLILDRYLCQTLLQKKDCSDADDFNPIEVFESLPMELQKCFEFGNFAALQETVREMSEKEAKYHLMRCINSGLYLPVLDETDQSNEDKVELTVHSN